MERTDQCSDVYMEHMLKHVEELHENQLLCLAFLRLLFLEIQIETDCIIDEIMLIQLDFLSIAARGCSSTWAVDVRFQFRDQI